MDPRHGEISRAMRNRGIEIYIPGEVGEVLACFLSLPKFDVRLKSGFCFYLDLYLL